MKNIIPVDVKKKCAFSCCYYYPLGRSIYANRSVINHRRDYIFIPIIEGMMHVIITMP